MATRSSVLAWGIPGTGEPGGLPSMESHRVWHDWSDLAAAAAAAGEVRRSILILQRNDKAGMRKVKGLGFPGDSDGKESACNPGDLGLIPGLGRSPGEENLCVLVEERRSGLTLQWNNITDMRKVEGLPIVTSDIVSSPRSLLLFSHPVVSNSLRLHGRQHARLQKYRWQRWLSRPGSPASLAEHRHQRVPSEKYLTVAAWRPKCPVAELCWILQLCDCPLVAFVSKRPLFELTRYFDNIVKIRRYITLGNLQKS